MLYIDFHCMYLIKVANFGHIVLRRQSTLKKTNSWIQGFVFWCNEQVNKLSCGCISNLHKWSKLLSLFKTLFDFFCGSKYLQITDGLVVRIVFVKQNLSKDRIDYKKFHIGPCEGPEKLEKLTLSKINCENFKTNIKWMLNILKSGPYWIIVSI